MTRLALLRHGHTAWNRAGRLQGRTDIPLDDAARTLLAGLRLPSAWRQADLVSSPLSRAVETARLVAGRAPRIEAALTEMHWGAWEGCKGADLLNARDSGYRNIEEWGWDYLPPDGETPRAVLARLRPWRDGLSGDTVAVCHIGVMRVLLAEATGWDFAGAPPFRIKRERLYVLTREGDGWSLAEAQPRLEARVP